MANPNVSINFLNGQRPSQLDLAEDRFLLIGPSSGGPPLRPILASQLPTVVNTFRHGPLAAQGSHHVVYSRPAVLMRAEASVDGAISSVTEDRVGASVGTCAASLTTAEAHADASGGLVLTLASGWVLPPQALPLSITVDNTCSAHVQTVTYVDEYGATKTEAVAFAATTAATKTTVERVTKVISVTSDIAPISTVAYDWIFTTPGDRYAVRWEFLRGGRVSGSPAQPRGRYSLDGGQTWSRRTDVPTTGVVDLYTYAPGLAPQATGVSLTFGNDVAAVQEIFGSYRANGSGANSDVLYSALVDGATIEHVVAGISTAFSIDVTGTDVVVNSATDGGGAATTTAAVAAAAINAHPLAKLIFLAAHEGTGAGVLATVAPADLQAASIFLAPLVEGVRYRTVAGAALGVSVSGKSVTVTYAVDSANFPTTTTSQIATALTGSSAASALLTASVDDGSFLPALTSYVSLTPTFETGDAFELSTTPPSMDAADLSDAIAAVLASEKLLGDVSAVVVVKDGADADDILSLQNLISSAAAKFLYLAAIIQARYRGDTAESTWLASVLADYPTLTGGSDPAVAIAAGEVDVVVPAYGTTSRLGAIVGYSARLANVPISENPAHVECGTLGASSLVTEFALPGHGEHPVPGTDPVQYERLYEADDTLITLHEEGFITLRVWPQASGVYVRDSIQYVDEADDYRRMTRRRITNVAGRLAYAEGRRYVKAETLRSPEGFIDEGEAQRIERSMDAVLRGKLLGEQRQHLSSLRVAVVRDDPAFVTSGVIQVNVFMQDRQSVETFEVNIGFQPVA